MESKQDGAGLAGQVRSLQVDDGHLAVWALGQQGYLFKGGNRVVVIDPYLSNDIQESGGGASEAVARLIPIPVQPWELTMADVVLATHHHPDHADPRTLGPLLEAAPEARLVTSYRARNELRAAGLDVSRAEAPPVGEAVDYGGGLSITAIPSAHYEQEPDAEGNPAYLGFIMNFGGVTVYHSGDTIIYPSLIERLKEHEIDLMCLPINGRDWFREQGGIVGNMDYREAAELTVAAGGRVLLPGHNDMFAGNRVNPAHLLDYLQANHPRQRVHFLKSGELYYYVP